MIASGTRTGSWRSSVPSRRAGGCYHKSRTRIIENWKDVNLPAILITHAQTHTHTFAMVSPTHQMGTQANRAHRHLCKKGHPRWTNSPRNRLQHAHTCPHVHAPLPPFPRHMYLKRVMCTLIMFGSYKTHPHTHMSNSITKAPVQTPAPALEKEAAAHSTPHVCTQINNGHTLSFIQTHTHTHVFI